MLTEGKRRAIETEGTYYKRKEGDVDQLFSGRNRDPVGGVYGGYEGNFSA